jgi:urea transport system permease protein
VGGRFALAGAILGAVVMGYAKTSFSEQFADGWLYLQGALFILVMTLAPKGILGLAASARDALVRRGAPEPPPEAVPGRRVMEEVA